MHWYKVDTVLWSPKRTHLIHSGGGIKKDFLECGLSWVLQVEEAFQTVRPTQLRTADRGRTLWCACARVHTRMCVFHLTIIKCRSCWSIITRQRVETNMTKIWRALYVMSRWSDFMYRYTVRGSLRRMRRLYLHSDRWPWLLGEGKTRGVFI